ncbi:MAG: hypothetical protein COT67_02345 [Candidatus Tagabacteria bacterium CG09_land_8_20_14_0_10_41_14]|uniref:Uncharacterized protein n=2 Tax=Candidatus Tagaibacteriota TaxID=1817918 RepID=A0A2H0WN27_9BACT|nr:MAG: hypothetical protein COT67_02345 [Candidatus Tagabacteria bacterium CG09_land_8_20_14_0_10_41_14]PJE73382.1 MAG: hypothetical protein COV00_00165 [Candidatus Tagabacteria bacterium CG10_big_fil_rev_8_21_14_0_10_40_13]
MKKRIISFLFLICVSVIFPLPVSVLLFVFFVVVFNKFWEGLVAGLFLDSLYLSPPFFDKHILGFFTVSFAITFLAVEWAKRLIQGENVFSKSVIFAAGLAVFGLFFVIFG